MSKIPWTEKTWNCIAGCTKVSAGCDNCYAEKMSCRLAHMEHAKIWNTTGLPTPSAGVSGGKYNLVIGTDNKWNGKVICDEKALDIPLHWKKPRMIFVNSMSDTFNKKVPFEFIDKIFQTIALCWGNQSYRRNAYPNHTFQILTKRPKIMLEYMSGNVLKRWGDGAPIYGALQNLWLGTTCENQETADKRIPILLQIPAAVRFISAEPLLGEINFDEYVWRMGGAGNMKKVDQVIIGAESIGGHPGRECKIKWVRNIVRQCKAAGVAVFVKQIHMWKVGNKKTGEYFETLEQASKFYSKRDSFPDITKPKRVLLKYPRDKDLFPKDLQYWEYPK